jgi:fluoride exporter
LDRYILVLIGGASGSLARYVIGGAIMSRLTTRFPAGTFFINITGSFLIGLIMMLFTERFTVHPNWRLLLVTGFLGGYTTFSSFEWETFTVMRDGRSWMGLFNAFGSVLLGFGAVWCGAILGSRRW